MNQRHVARRRKCCQRVESQYPLVRESSPDMPCARANLLIRVAVNPRSEPTPIVDECKMFVKKSWIHPEILPESVTQPSVGWIANILQEIYGSFIAETGLETLPMVAMYPT